MYTAKSKINACVNDPDWPLDVYRYQRPMGPMTAWRLTAERWRKSHQWCVPVAVVHRVHSSVLILSACEAVHRQVRARACRRSLDMQSRIRQSDENGAHWSETLSLFVFC